MLGTAAPAGRSRGRDGEPSDHKLWLVRPGGVYHVASPAAIDLGGAAIERAELRQRKSERGVPVGDPRLLGFEAVQIDRKSVEVWPGRDAGPGTVLVLDVGRVKGVQVQEGEDAMACRQVGLDERVDPVHPGHAECGPGLKVHRHGGIVAVEQDVGPKLCGGHLLRVCLVLQPPQDRLDTVHPTDDPDRPIQNDIPIVRWEAGVLEDCALMLEACPLVERVEAVKVPRDCLPQPRSVLCVRCPPLDEAITEESAGIRLIPPNVALEAAAERADLGLA
mmetsp:Transcript_35650/g.93186  ORF Transcript_35650/g.93186 Transcript_35650/m.93186 type:complete len:277 (+) Transcript_35650:68-898(+)